MNSADRTKNIASYIIKLAKPLGKVDHLKLQKLLYYVDAWHLVYRDKPLFTEEFEAWVHGPVLRSVYRQYGADLFSPIDPIVSRPDLSCIDESTKKLISDVVEVYAVKTSYELECMTHAERPWKLARRGLAPTERSEKKISKAVTRRYFSELLNQ